MTDRPLIPIVISFIAGIIIFNFYPQDFKLSFIIFFFFIFLCISLITFIIKFYSASALTSLLLFFILGAFFGNLDRIDFEKSKLSKISSKTNVSIEGVVENINWTKNKKTRIELQINKINKKSVDTDEKILAFSKEKIEVNYGDIIEINAKIITPKSYKNPASFSYLDYLKRKKISKIIYIDDSYNIKKVGTAKINILKGFAGKIREKITEVYSKTLPEPYSSILSSIVIGNKAVYIDKEIEDVFRKIGTIHLLVASGSQVSLLLSLFLFIFYFNKIKSIYLKILISIPVAFVLVLYGYIVGENYPIIRAIVMGIIFIFSIIFTKEFDPLSALFASCFIILLFSPSSIWDIGFILSFLTCFGIIYIAPLIFNKLKTDNFPNFQSIYLFIITIFATTISAQIMIIPILSYYFNQISIISPIANLFAIPIVCLLLPIGLLSGILGIININFAVFINIISGFLIYLLLKVSEILANIKFASIEVNTPNIFEITVYYLIVFGIINFKKLKLNFTKAVIAILIFISCIILNNLWYYNFKKELKITFIDVGQGDSTLIQTPHGKNILIDGGGVYSDSGFDVGEKVLLPLFRNYRIKKFDIVILTHPHRDHLGGLLKVVEKYKVQNVVGDFKDLKIQSEEENILYEKFVNIIKRKNIKLLHLYRGDKIDLQNAVFLTILNPRLNFLQNTESDIDNNSVVVKLNYKKVSFLFTADIMKEAEYNLIKDNIDIKSNFLKVAHHGSNTSTTEEFLEKVSPSYAIISAGEGNPFGHPHQDTLRRLKKFGCEIFRTDTDGAIIVSTDGERINITTQKRGHTVKRLK